MIFISNLTKITDTKYLIGFQHNMPFDPVNGIKHENGSLYTEEELKQIGKLVDYNGDTSKTLYYNPVSNTCFTEDTTISLDDAKQLKIEELEDDCTKIKDNGFKSNCLGTEKVFDSSAENRNLIIGLAMKASLIANGSTLTDSNIDWKAKDEPVCYTWTPQQMIVLGVDMSTFLTNTIKHKEQLQQYVNTLTTIEEVNAVTWDTVIPTTTT